MKKFDYAPKDITTEEIELAAEELFEVQKYSSIEANHLYLQLMEDILLTIATGHEDPWLLACSFQKSIFEDPDDDEDNED